MSCSFRAYLPCVHCFQYSPSWTRGTRYQDLKIALNIYTFLAFCRILSTTLNHKSTHLAILHITNTSRGISILRHSINLLGADLRQYCSKILLMHWCYPELTNSNPFRILTNIAHTISYSKHIHLGTFNCSNIFFDDFT